MTRLNTKYNVDSQLQNILMWLKTKSPPRFHHLLAHITFAITHLPDRRRDEDGKPNYYGVLNIRIQSDDNGLILQLRERLGFAPTLSSIQAGPYRLDIASNIPPGMAHPPHSTPLTVSNHLIFE
jgi:hypothetical protein